MSFQFLSSKSVQQRFHFLVWLKEKPADRSFLFCKEKYLGKEKSLKATSVFTPDAAHQLGQKFVLGL